MIVIVVVAIFVTVGVPSFQNIVNENRLATHANDLVSSLHFARSEAIKRRLPVAVCRTANGTTCVIGGTSSWETGWLVFVDDNNNGAFNSGAGEILLRSAPANSFNTLRSNDSNIDDTVRFRNNGLLANTGGSFDLCNLNTANTATGRQILINVTGQVVTQQPATSCP